MARVVVALGLELARDWELLLVYIATVGGSEVAKKFLNMRYGTNGKSDDSKGV